ncbi:hypothetical protein Aduo_010724 [Ancylostoma duodenale]
MFKLCCGIVLFATCLTFSQVEAYTHEEKQTFFEGAIELMGGEVKEKYVELIAELKKTIEKQKYVKIEEDIKAARLNFIERGRVIRLKDRFLGKFEKQFREYIDVYIFMKAMGLIKLE